MYRQSLYPGGASSLSSTTSAPPSQSAVSALADKQRQVAHFHDLLKHSQNLVQLYEAYAEKYHLLVGGSEAVGDVVEHWQNVFRSTSLALGSIDSQKRAAQSASSVRPDRARIELARDAKPDQLVRLPVEQADHNDPASSSSPS